MAINKRYQVFISSTFRDLIEERQAVLKAVLELDHMPAGMELFPASDATAWDLIKDVIDASDYYVLIIGGRYGSLDEEGIGYTEKEYDYAVASKKPVIPLLITDPEKLPREKTETDEAAWKKLDAFRAKVESSHTCVYWDSSGSLKSHVIVGLTATVKKIPGVGWIRADQIPSGTTITDVLELRNRISELEAELEETRTEAPPGTEDLHQGDDAFKMSCTAEAGLPGQWYSSKSFRFSFNPTWNEIFAGVAPTLINEANDYKIRDSISTTLSQMVKNEFSDHADIKGKELRGFQFETHDFDTIIVQLRALGLIKESDKKRSIKDTSTYWTLTPYGDRAMVQLRALRRTSQSKQREAGVAAETPPDKPKSAKE